MTLAFAIQALRRHIVLVLVTGVVVTGAGIALGSSLPKSYGSNTQILLGLDPPGKSIDPQSASVYLKEQAMTYAQVATADDVITPVANAADLDPEELRGRVVAAVVPETVVLDLRVTGPSPEEAVALTQALTKRFRFQVSALNVQTGGPRILTAQLSAPQPATAPDQLHGKTLAAVSALVGVTVAVLLALVVAVVQRNRRRIPSDRDRRPPAAHGTAVTAACAHRLGPSARSDDPFARPPERKDSARERGTRSHPELRPALRTARFPRSTTSKSWWCRTGAGITSRPCSLAGRPT